jgi:hypothetical protein
MYSMIREDFYNRTDDKEIKWLEVWIL